MAKGVLFVLLALAGASLFLRLTSSYDDYYTLLDFHVQKKGLSSLLLFLALFAGFIMAYVNAQNKLSKMSLLVVGGGLLVFIALVIPQDMIKFNRRVNNGTLGEKTGDIPPLMLAAYQGNLQEMEKLIKNGADVNDRNKVNNTPLHFAAGAAPVSQTYRGSPAAVAYLIEHGADVNAQNNTNTTPLMDAVLNPNLESVKILLAHGADVNRQSKYDLDTTALTEAIRRIGQPPPGPWQAIYRNIAIELIRHGANPNFKDLRGITPLQTAEELHDDGLIKELKDHGAKE
jgi:hypothetical protein